MRKLFLILLSLFISHILLAQPVAYYPFNGNANDESGNGNNGTVYGAALTYDRFGNPNSAYRFNGVTDWIDIQPSSSLNLQNELTLSAWVNFPIFQPGGSHIMMKSLRPDTYEYGFSFNTVSSLNRIEADMGGYNVVSSKSSVLQTCTWNNITATWKYPGYCVFYTNGVRGDSVPTTGNITPEIASHFTIGRIRPGQPLSSFKGVVDDIRLYNYNLSYAEIAQLYHEGGTFNNSSITVNTGNDTTIYYGYGSQNANLTAVPSGGTPPYSYLWSNSATTQSITVFPTSTTSYNVTATDANGCTASDTITVIVIDVRCGNNNNKVLVCHNGHMICISANAVPAHLAHGDQLGNCSNNNPEEIISEEMPFVFQLYVNYPNPFNPITKIKYDIPRNAFVKLTIYDIGGREVDVLVNEQMEAGKYNVDWDASNYTSGAYFYKLTAGDYSEMKKMILLK